MDIRAFNEIPNNELPQELFNLDILDGSPPCTTFSMAGKREKTWGKKKKFREGQKEQTLDDLSFVFIDTVAKLNYPKLELNFNYEKVPYGLIKTPHGLPLSENRAKTKELLANVKYGETDLAGASMRLYNKNSFFNSQVLYDDRVAPTIRAGAADYYRYGTQEKVSQQDIITIRTFPQDYNFVSNAIRNVC